jgi:hypothetical protein
MSANTIDQCPNIKSGRTCPCKHFTIPSDALQLECIVGFFPDAKKSKEDGFEVRFAYEKGSSRYILSAHHDKVFTREFLKNAGAREFIKKFEKKFSKHLGDSFRVSENGKDVTKIRDVYHSESSSEEDEPAEVASPPDQQEQEQEEFDFGFTYEPDGLFMDAPLNPEVPEEIPTQAPIQVEEQVPVPQPPVMLNPMHGRSANWWNIMPRYYTRLTDYKLRPRRQKIHYFFKRPRKNQQTRGPWILRRRQ